MPFTSFFQFKVSLVSPNPLSHLVGDARPDQHPQQRPLGRVDGEPWRRVLPGGGGFERDQVVADSISRICRHDNLQRNKITYFTTTFQSCFRSDKIKLQSPTVINVFPKTSVTMWLWFRKICANWNKQTSNTEEAKLKKINVFSSNR